MDRLDMQTKNIADENYAALVKLFPNALTEKIVGYDEDGKAIVERAIDADVLRQEISCSVVEGREERYQFTWPDKKKAMLLANAPITATLRPCVKESVDFYNTENLYIEGDNLDVLKLLQETYLGKIKMIYIDPPYNTGKDFVYNDNFTMDISDYKQNSGQVDEIGNRLIQNTESSGRYHTDWLNMIYSRLKLAKNLLSEDGVIFISIDDSENKNLRNICSEIFGESNFVAQFTRKGSGGRQDSKYYAIVHEYIVCFAKNIAYYESGKIVVTDDSYPFYDESKKLHYKTQLLRKWGENSKRTDRPNLYYPIQDPDGNDFYPMVSDTEEGCWRWGKEKMCTEIENGKVEFKKKNGNWIAYEKIFEPTEDNLKTKLYNTVIDDVSNNTGTALIKTLFDGKVFDYPKPVDYILRLMKMTNLKKGDIILDFFSGSATSAHAVMEYNREYEMELKYIMVQLPEETSEKSEAYNLGYSTICEIGKERIRRAAKKLCEENPIVKFDIDFRVLKLDSSNMKDIYYNPEQIQQHTLFESTDNIKEDRTPEDLLFQVMLDLGVLLSSKIEEKIIAGKKVFNVADGFLIACFDNDVTEETVKAVAQEKPYYAVFRDSCMANDSVATNFEQIFATYSPETVRKVL